MSALDLFLCIDHLLLGAGFQAFGLLILIVAVDTGLQPLLAQIEHFAGALKVIFRQIQHAVGMPQIAVGLCHIGRQGQARSVAVDFGSAGFAQSRFPGIPLAAPQVEGVIEGQTDVTHRVITTTLAGWILGA